MNNSAFNRRRSKFTKPGDNLMQQLDAYQRAIMPQGDPEANKPSRFGSVE